MKRPAAFGLIIVGDEILSGKRADKHMPKVIELLGARGLQLSWSEYVGDDPTRITAALVRAFVSGDVVFSTGGIGATPDDHTRQCAARALGVPLVLHPEAEAADPRAHAGHRARAGHALRARPARQHPPAQHGRVPAGRAHHSQPVQQDPGLQRRRRCISCRVFRSWRGRWWSGCSTANTPHLFRREVWIEKSVIVFGAMEAALTPLMEQHRRSPTPASRCSACRASITRSTAVTSSLASRGAGRGRPGLLRCWPPMPFNVIELVHG
jgi:molybdopterin-biosynthesis enzyme MoeA-like protein